MPANTILMIYLLRKHIRLSTFRSQSAKTSCPQNEIVGIPRKYHVRENFLSYRSRFEMSTNFDTRGAYKLRWGSRWRSTSISLFVQSTVDSNSKTKVKTNQCSLIIRRVNVCRCPIRNIRYTCFLPIASITPVRYIDSIIRNDVKISVFSHTD